MELVVEDISGLILGHRCSILGIVISRSSSLECLVIQTWRSSLTRTQIHRRVDRIVKKIATQWTTKEWTDWAIKEIQILIFSDSDLKMIN